MFCELLMKYFLQYLLKWKVTDFHMDLLLTLFYCLLVLTCHLNNCNYLFYFEISSVCTLIKIFLRFGLFTSGDSFQICRFELSPKAFGGYFFSGFLSYKIH